MSVHRSVAQPNLNKTLNFWLIIKQIMENKMWKRVTSLSVIQAASQFGSVILTHGIFLCRKFRSWLLVWIGFKVSLQNRRSLYFLSAFNLAWRNFSLTNHRNFEQQMKIKYTKKRARKSSEFEMKSEVFLPKKAHKRRKHPNFSSSKWNQ